MFKSLSLWPFFLFLAAVWAPLVVSVHAVHDFFEFPVWVFAFWLVIGLVGAILGQWIFKNLPRWATLPAWFVFWFLILNHFVVKATFLSGVPHLKKVVLVLALALSTWTVRTKSYQKIASNIGLICLFISLGVFTQLSDGHLWSSGSSRGIESSKSEVGGRYRIFILMDMFSVQQSLNENQKVMSAARQLAEKHRLTLYKNHYTGYRTTVQSVPQIIGNQVEAWDANQNLLPSEQSVFQRAAEEGSNAVVFGQRPTYCRFHRDAIGRCFAGRGEESELVRRLPNEIYKSAAIFATSIHPNLSNLFSNKLSKDLVLRLPESPLEQIERFKQVVSSTADGADHFFYLHTLFPHSPFVVDDACKVNPALQGKDQALHFEGDQRERYIQQSLCAIKKLDEIFTLIASKSWGDKARVLVVSDHGRPGRIENSQQPSQQNIRNASHVYAWSKAPGQSEAKFVDGLTSNSKLEKFLFENESVLPSETSVNHTWFVPGKSKTLERLEFNSEDGMVWNLKQD